MKWIRTALLLSLVPFSLPSASAKEIRVGLIGLDTSHVIVFTRIFNDNERADHVPGARVVAAWTGMAAR